MTRKIKTFLFVLLCMIIMQGSLPLQAEAKKETDSPTVEFQKFLYALQLIRQHYVDPEKVSYRNLFKLALQGLLKELDPY